MSETTVNGSGEPLTMELEGGFTPEEMAGPPSVETTGSWTCECGHFNNPNTFDKDADPSECQTCGLAAPDPEDDEAFNARELSPEQIAAGLQNLSGGVATAQDVENAARAEEGLPPRDQAAEGKKRATQKAKKPSRAKKGRR